jgi:hypothetical protein
MSAFGGKADLPQAKSILFRASSIADDDRFQFDDVIATTTDGQTKLWTRRHD